MEVLAGRGRNGASTLDIGEAVTARWSRRMSKADRDAVGLAMATRLVRDGLAVATRGNRFMLPEYDGEAVPPAVRVEDVPAPGFAHVPPQGHAVPPVREKARQRCRCASCTEWGRRLERQRQMENT